MKTLDRVEHDVVERARGRRSLATAAAAADVGDAGLRQDGASFLQVSPASGPGAPFGTSGVGGVPQLGASQFVYASMPSVLSCARIPAGRDARLPSDYFRTSKERSYGN